MNDFMLEKESGNRDNALKLDAYVREIIAEKKEERAIALGERTIYSVKYEEEKPIVRVKDI
jgi:hypothetical protein